jgi:putative phosphoribosyl transferase
VRKIGAPDQEEFAIGAIDENGSVQVSPEAALAGADDRYIEQAAAGQLATIRKRRELYSPHHTAIDAAGRVVIVVDDGLATGATMQAALRAVRARAPARLVCAVPVASPRGLSEVAELADDLVYLLAPHYFRAVGQFYAQFPAVDDTQVMQWLKSPSRSAAASSEAVRIGVDGVVLNGDLASPEDAVGLVVFANGSGSHRTSERNRYVASTLHARGFATLLLDLLTADEAREVSARFDIPKLASRLNGALQWAAEHAGTASLPVGLFGASTGAAAALVLAARHPSAIKAVVSQGGRPDLAGEGLLTRVQAPALLIVGGADTGVIELNRAALAALTCPAEMMLVPHATHLFEEPGALETVAELAADWFGRWLQRSEALRDGVASA